MTGCKPVDTPVEYNAKLGVTNNEVPISKERYQSQFMQASYKEHMNVVDRILQYLKGTPGKGPMFRKSGKKTIEAYTDSDWAGSVIDRKPTSGYCNFVWGNLVTWRSKKQGVVARSSEFRDM
ncbi:secreted RxLR effector protein 161-like [Benincasa hispida]|uniref:secreted RxLR effector protein 161-like n=1 Tax=Benincasa hispida TaxID=102211 RepID=UPI0018FFF596|nr:secreted RxLR effector protein 161-like [Benincasa hispida]